MSALKPDTDDTHDLGTSALRWRNLFVHDIDIATNISTAGSFVFEGATPDAHETTFGVVDPTADRSINLPNQSGTIPVLAAVSATAITSTPEELSILDGGTSATATTLADADRVVVNDNGTMVQVAMSDFETFMESSLDTLSNAISINNDTASSSKTTGALKVEGGISTQADLYVGDDIVLENDGAELVFGADKEVKLVHTDSVGLHLNAGMRLAFRDQGDEYITSASDSNLKIAAATTLNLVSATIDVDGALDVSGTSALAGNVTVGGGVGSTGVTITDAGAISADARIITNDLTDATNGTDGSLQTDGGLSVAKAAFIGTDLTVSDDIVMSSDSAQIALGANSDITLTHVADTGLTIEGSHANGTNLKLNNTAGDGDARVEFQLDGTTTWSMGVEDGDSDKFVIERGAGVLGAAPALEILADGTVAVKGNLTVAGTTTTENTTIIESTVTVLQFEGANDNDHETQLKVVEPTADTTFSLPALSAGDYFIPAIIGTATDASAAVTAAEFALLDGGSTVGTTAVAGGDGILTNDNGTMQQTSVDTFDTYLSGTTKTLTNKTISSGILTACTVTTSLLPTLTDGAALGSVDKEFSDLFLADGGTVQFGNEQDITLTHVTDTGITMAGSHANGTNLKLNNTAGDGDARIELQLSGTTAWSVGVEDGDSDKFVIEDGAGALGADPAFEIADDKSAKFYGTLEATTSFTIGSAEMTEADLEQLDGITAGTAAASKAVVLDASSDTSGIRNLTITGTFSDGNYTFDDSGNVTGLGNITSTGSITAATSMLPDSSGGADLGSTSLEWGDLYIADDKMIKLGSNQDSTIEYDENGDNVLQIAGANVRIGHGAATQLQFRDSAVHISSDLDGHINVQADTQVSLNVNGADALALTSTTATFGTNIVIPNSGNIGSVGDADAIAISNAGVITLSNDTDSSNATTGALVVTGGLGVAKKMSVGGNLNVINKDITVANANVSTVRFKVDGDNGNTTVGGDLSYGGTLTSSDITSGAARSMDGTEYIYLVTTDGVTVTLPAAGSTAPAGQRFIIKQTASHSSGTTIARASDDLIDGGTSCVLGAAVNGVKSFVEVICDGTNYHIINSGGTTTVS